jgi:alkaline phosphatase
MKLSRRDVLGLSAVAVTASALPVLAFGAPKMPKRKPKNIIYMVADGMALQTVSMADQYLHLVEGKHGYWRWLLDQDFATHALQDTRSLSSVVTDSAAAASAWGSGRHVWNGMINMFPGGTKLTTINELMRGIGMKTGLVTTTTITHATPSGFSIQILQRDLERLIAEQHLTTNVDVLMGGGDKFFSANPDKGLDDLYPKFAAKGYTVMKNRSEMLAAKGTKFLGIFSSGHIPYTVDQKHDASLQAVTPTLAEMTQFAIDRLKGSKEGFLLQVEGGRVDHAGHTNDAAALIHDQIAFEQAMKVAIDFAQKDGETLVVITTDHACGGPSLNGAGDEYFDSTAGLKSVASFAGSYDSLEKAWGKAPKDTDIQDVVYAKYRVRLSAEESAAVRDAISGRSPFRLNSFMGSWRATLAQVLGNTSKIGFTSTNHSSDHVLMTAMGPGREMFSGFVPNVAVFDRLLALRGLKHSNPTMSFEEAQSKMPEVRAAISPELWDTYATHDDCGCGHGVDPWLAHRER